MPDFEARISIFKACLRKSPVDPKVDYEYFADRTDGFSGADIAGVCKAAAKTAIRSCIDTERKKFEAREAKKKKAAEEGKEYESDEEDKKEEDVMPFLTVDMIKSALALARRSVTQADLQKYMRYKRDMERKLGMDEGAAKIDGMDEHVVGLNPAPQRFPDAPAAQPAAQAGAAQPAAYVNPPTTQPSFPFARPTPPLSLISSACVAFLQCPGRCPSLVR